MSLTTWTREPAYRPAAERAAARAAAPGVAVAPRVASGRRGDLDVIRVAAFGLLILYHVSLAYSPFDWHIHSAYTFDGLRAGLLITQPWRLTLLFLVSGAALRLASGGKSAPSVLASRAARLGPPLVFGVLLLVPVQAWIEATDKGSWRGDLWGWMAQQFSPAGVAAGVPVNHLWFVVYIAVYTVIALPLLARPASTAAVERALERALSGWRLLLLPAAYLILARVCLYYRFGLTNALVGDWYNHAQSLGAFLFGFLMVRREAVWAGFERLRWPAAALAAVALPVAMIQAVHPGGGAFHEVPRNAVFALDQWTTMVAILGFASRHLRGVGGPRLRYLNDAVFPCYLAHQTILVLAVWVVRPARLPAPVEIAILVAATVGGSLLTYEVVRRIPLIRPLWGLKRQARSAPRPASAAG